MSDTGPAPGGTSGSSLILTWSVAGRKESSCTSLPPEKLNNYI